MCHSEQLVFFENLSKKFPDYFFDKKVLEVGSLDINGSIRRFFTSCDYIGVDIGEGPGVDVVCEGQNLKYEDNCFEVAVSSECFEHNPYWLETFLNMIRMTKSNGLVAFSCATDGRPEHGTSKNKPGHSPLTVSRGEEYKDYYKNLNKKDFMRVIDFDSIFEYYNFSVVKCDLYFYGVKK